MILGSVITLAAKQTPVAKEPVEKIDDELIKLKKQRVEALSQQVKLLSDRAVLGRDSETNIINAVKSLCYAKLDLDWSTEKQGEALEEWVKNTKEILKLTKGLAEGGIRAQHEEQQSLAAYLEAQIELLKFKKQLPDKAK
jgi:hypothetical protein